MLGELQGFFKNDLPSFIQFLNQKKTAASPSCFALSQRVENTAQDKVKSHE